MSPQTVLVVGATGNTGKYVVQMLLTQGHTVKALARSKERLLSVLPTTPTSASTSTENLQVTEASILDMSQSELDALVEGCTAVVSCLGHTMTMEGLYGTKSRRLCLESVQRLTKAIQTNTNNGSGIIKLIVMGTDGATIPGDPPRTRMERLVLWLLRHCLPPHADNEETAAFLLALPPTALQWSVVRPTDLQDGDPRPFDLHDTPPGGLFGAAIATRSNVAQCMVEFITDNAKWQRYNHKMPVLYDCHDNDNEEGDAKKSK